jgi:hypothetical protein
MVLTVALSPNAQVIYDNGTFYAVVPDLWPLADPSPSSLTRLKRRDISMVTLGIDPHEHVHVAVAVDARGRPSR